MYKLIGMPDSIMQNEWIMFMDSTNRPKLIMNAESTHIVWMNQ